MGIHCPSDLPAMQASLVLFFDRMVTNCLCNCRNVPTLRNLVGIVNRIPAKSSAPFQKSPFSCKRCPPVLHYKYQFSDMGGILLSPKHPRWSTYWILAAIYILFFAGMLYSAIHPSDTGIPLLSFVLSFGWLALAIREIYFYFRDKKAAKDS